jgi:hypothetical protein
MQYCELVGLHSRHAYQLSANPFYVRFLLLPVKLLVCPLNKSSLLLPRFYVYFSTLAFILNFLALTHSLARCNNQLCIRFIIPECEKVFKIFNFTDGLLLARLTS